MVVAIASCGLHQVVVRRTPESTTRRKNLENRQNLPHWLARSRGPTPAARDGWYPWRMMVPCRTRLVCPRWDVLPTGIARARRQPYSRRRRSSTTSPVSLGARPHVPPPRLCFCPVSGHPILIHSSSGKGYAQKFGIGKACSSVGRRSAGGLVTPVTLKAPRGR